MSLSFLRIVLLIPKMKSVMPFGFNIILENDTHLTIQLISRECFYHKRSRRPCKTWNVVQLCVCVFFKCYYVDFSFDSFVGQLDQSTYFQIESSLERLKRNLLDCCFITTRGNQQRRNKKVERHRDQIGTCILIQSNQVGQCLIHNILSWREKQRRCTRVTLQSLRMSQIFHSVKNKLKRNNNKRKKKT